MREWGGRGWESGDKWLQCVWGAAVTQEAAQPNFFHSCTAGSENLICKLPKARQEALISAPKPLTSKKITSKQHESSEERQQRSLVWTKPVIFHSSYLNWALNIKTWGSYLQCSVFWLFIFKKCGEIKKKKWAIQLLCETMKQHSRLRHCETVPEMKHLKPGTGWKSISQSKLIQILFLFHISNLYKALQTTLWTIRN